MFSLKTITRLSRKATGWPQPLLGIALFCCSAISSFGQCTLPDPPIVSTDLFWNNFDVDGNPISDEFGILHYFTGSKIIAYGSLVNVHVSGGDLVNVADGVAFDGTEDFTGAGEYLDLAAGDWQIVFKYIPDGRLGFLNFTVTNDGVEATPDSIEVTRFGLQDPTDSDGIIAGDCLSLGNTALPVELAAFQAQAVDASIVLEWTTASEVNNLGFDIQRSIDAKQFQTIGWQAGQGSTTKSTPYTFVDDQLQSNITYYYRLVNRDIGGGGQKSPLRSARVRGINSASVSPAFPNPVFGDQTHLQIVGQKAHTVQLQIFDGLGQLLRQEELAIEKGPNIFDLAVGHLPSGHYYILVQDDRDIAKRRFLISR